MLMVCPCVSVKGTIVIRRVVDEEFLLALQRYVGICNFREPLKEDIEGFWVKSKLRMFHCKQCETCEYLASAWLRTM